MAIALGDGELLMAEIAVDAGRSHLELLLPSIDHLLDANGVRLADVKAIVTGTGPGTFSGLRVGIATARALAQTLEVPLAGFSTLDALAHGLAAGIDGTGPVMLLPMIDAKRGQVFTRLYKKEGEKGVMAESDVLCLDPEELAVRLPSMTATRVRAGGNGAIAYRDIFSAAGQIDLLAADHRGNFVSASWHLRAAASQGGFDPRTLLTVVPEYVRDPDADKTILLRKKEPWLK